MTLSPKYALAAAGLAAVLALAGCGTTTVNVIIATPKPTASQSAQHTPAPTPQTIATLCAGQWSAQGLHSTFPVQVSISGDGESCTSLTPTTSQEFPASTAQLDGAPDELAPITGAQWQAGGWVIACTTSVQSAQLAVWVQAGNTEYVAGGIDICAEQLQPIEKQDCKAASGSPLFDAGGMAQCNFGYTSCPPNGGTCAPASSGLQWNGPCTYYRTFNTDGTVNMSPDAAYNESGQSFNVATCTPKNS